MHFICSALVRRLSTRDRMETDDEKRVPDIVEEPLHISLDNLATAAATSSTVYHTLEGPADDEVVNVAQSLRPFACGKTISTYPLRPNNTQRDGDPICDRYKAHFFPNHVIAVVADGCNWGFLPRQAGINASDAFARYLCNHHNEIRNVRYAGSLVLRAFAMAQAAVIGTDPDTPTGTTTLLGGIAMELDEDDEFANTTTTPSSSSTTERPPRWGFVYGSVGDCKAFHYSASEKQWQDITESNRQLSRDPTDCGGRLGRMTATHGPDLRNFELGFFPCDAGDIIIIVSDGVHDNLDPQSLGKPPNALGINASSWDEVDLQESEVLKNKFRINLLKSLVGPSMPGGLSPSSIVETLLAYCQEINSAAVNWMCENPTKPLPKDYIRYPGKMDHTTCLCFVVGRLPPTN
jgi:hypothetical protein